MLKFTNHLTNANLLLIKRQVGGEGTCAAFVVMRSPVRRYAKDQFSEKCPPVSKPARSRKLLYGMIGATMLTGAAIVYAKNSPEARGFLETNVPWANNVVALVYQENQTHWEFTVNQLTKAKKSFLEFMFGKEGNSPMDFKQRSEQDLERDSIKFFEHGKDYELPSPILEPLYVEEPVITTPDVIGPSNVVRTDKCEPQKPIEIKITKDIVELEQEMLEFSKKAIDTYKHALTACAAYNKALTAIIEKDAADLEKKHFETLKSTRTERDRILADSKAAALKAKCAIETLERTIIAKGIKAPPENLTITRRYIRQFSEDIGKMENAVNECVEKSVLMDRFRDKVEAARKAYQDELEALFPELDMKARQLDIRGETDLLLLYTMKQVQFLQKEIAEATTIRETQLNRALECKDEKALIDMKVDDMIRKDRLKMEEEHQRKLLVAEATAHRKMRKTLQRQMEVNLDVLNARIQQKEKEIETRITRAVSVEVEKERTKFKKELAAMVGKLQAIEQTLKSRAKAEADARRSQALWLAAESLLAATRKQECLTKIDNELTALEKAGKDDKLVETILKGIPKEVREEGIVTEICLKENFDKLEDTAKKVALIGREGAALPMYFLSWLQSKLLFQKLAEIPRDELENKPTDFCELDTFDIIHRARYHMDHGNLDHAMRYVNLLQGAPRAAALAWLDAARNHLEIRQAAEAVMAHAALAGMLKK